MARYLCFIWIILCCTACENKREAEAVKNIQFTIPNFTKKPNPIPVLVIDAGHGGDDPGAINDSLKLYEKNVSRKMVDALVRILDTNKIKVIQTRKKDDAVNRHDRVTYATQYNPDLLITLHTNFHKDTTVNGFEVSYSDSTFQGLDGLDTIKLFNPNQTKLHQYAEIFTNKIALNFPKMKKRKVAVRKDDIWIIYAPTFPSILIEWGFISNKKDAALMSNKKEINKLAKSLRNGIYEIFKIK